MSVTKVSNDNILSMSAAKLTGAMPAMDGSALTGIVAGSEAMTGASDPANETNPADGVGALWINTTTGEMFICVDATTDGNVWNNVGEGSGDVAYVPPVAYGYQGLQNVYSSGGYIGATFDNIETHTIQSDGNSTSVGTLTVARGISAGSSSTTHGHVAGGVGWPYLSVIDKFSFASGGNAVTHANLASPGGYYTGWTDWDVAGYVVGGRDADSNGNNGVDVNKIRKYSFSSSATSVETGDTMLPTGAYWGTSGITDRVNGYGYGAGDTGTSAPYTGHNTRIQRYAFNSSSNSVAVGNLTWSTRISSQGVNTDTHGFTIGGGGPNEASPGLLNKFAFSTGVTAVEWGHMFDSSDAGGASCTPSGLNHGYILSGAYYTGGQTPKSYRFSYASIATHTYIGDLGYSASYNTPNQY
jgi:hypothetical protein